MAAINRNDSEPEQTENFYETRDSHTLRSTGSRLKRERRFARIKDAVVGLRLFSRQHGLVLFGFYLG